MAKTIRIRNTDIEFYPQLYVYIPDLSCVVLSDVHLAKSNHFRRNGIALTQGIHQNDLNSWGDILIKHNPDTCIIAGDLFHSNVKEELQHFYQFLNEHSSISFILTTGNHDSELTAPPDNLVICDRHQLGPFRFSHEMEEREDLYQFCGHLHPIVTVNGKAKRQLSFKAFWIRSNACILPAFGYTTYGLRVDPVKDDLLLAAGHNQLITIDQSNFSKIQR